MSNDSWTLGSSDSWISINNTSGSGCDTVKFNVSLNDTNNDRTGYVYVYNLNMDIVHTITINQQSGDGYSLLNIINATSPFTEVDNSEVSEDNIYDNDPSTRWSANGNDGSVYLDIELNCIHKVSSVGIDFYNSSERTSTFQLFTSKDGIEFTEASSITTSKITEGNQIFNLHNHLQAKFIRIVGYGNSISAWNSYSEVSVYGHSDCNTTLTHETLKFDTNDVLIFPNPTTNIIYIKSNDIIRIQLYTLSGVLIKNFENVGNTPIDISKLSTGTYIIQVEDSLGNTSSYSICKNNSN